MDDHEKKPSNDGASDWLDVTQSYQRGDARKLGPYVTVSKHGAVEATVEATAIVEDVALARGLRRHQWVFLLKARVEHGQVCCIPIPVEQSTDASAPVRWILGQGSPRSAFHIGGALKSHPKLALTGDVKCLVAKGTAPDGLPMLVIPVKAVLNTQTTHRKTDESPGAQGAAGAEPKA